MGVRRLVAAAAVVAVGLAVSGCGDDPPKPRASESASQSPSESASDSGSPSESPTSTSEPALEEPTPPAAMQGDDAAAAEAFVKHYYENVNYALATGDVRGLKTLGLASCAPCAGGAQALHDIYRKGGRIDGGQFTVDAAEVTGTSERPGQSTNFFLTVTASTSAQEVFDRRGAVENTYPANTSRYRYHVIRTGSGWKVATWSQRS